MNAQQLYELYRESYLARNVIIEEPWDQLDAVDQEVWELLVSEMERDQ
jgi:hypothetical protein